MPNWRTRPTPESPRLGKHIPSLDGLRGLAIILVLVQHFNLLGNRVSFDRVMSNVSLALWVGVDLFFVLSGFLITGILCDAKGAQNYFRNFYVRRVLRIFPLYYGFLICLVFLLPRVTSGYASQVQTVVAHQGWLWTYTTNVLLAVQQDWATAVPSANHFWSLAVEEQFYVLWPAIVWLCNRKQLIRACVLMLLVAPAVRVALLLRGDNYIAAYVLTPARLDSLALGGLIAVLIRDPNSFDLIRQYSKPVMAIGAVGIVITFLWTGHFVQPDLFVRTAGYSVVAWFFSGLLVQTVATQSSIASRAFRNRVLQAFGRHSYALYVLHPSVRRLMFDHILPRFHFPTIFGSQIPKQLTALASCTTVAFALSWTSWHLFEKHFLKLKDLFPYGMKEKATTALAADATGTEATTGETA